MALGVKPTARYTRPTGRSRMIVICTKCQAKFRVADEKIGARGAKVRCSKCQTVFLVHPALGTVPVTDGEGGDASPGGSRAAPARGGRPPPVAAPAPPPDPFGAGDPFAASAPLADPFAPSPDRFAAADPFAAQSPPAANAVGDLGDPFVAAVSPRSTLPVTDLSDLLGAGSAAPPRAQAPPPLPAPAPPRDDPFAAPAPAEALAPPAAAPPGADPFGGDPFASAPAAAAPAPEDGLAAPDLELAPRTPLPDDGGLALEDRLTPPPKKLGAPTPVPHDQGLEQGLEAEAPAAPPEHAAAADPFAAFTAAPAGAAAEPFDPGAFEFGGDEGAPLAEEEPSLAAATPPPIAAPRAAPTVAPAFAPPAPAAPAPAPAPAPAAPRAAPPDAAPERVPGRPRLRAVAVNAVALFALLVVALALWAVWRTEGPFEAASLRPSAILAALGRGAASGPWSAQDVRSGVYDRVRGAPLLFVRGRVVSRAAAPVTAVKVAVEVVRGGQVLARGEALAGAVPTEEELYLAADDAAVAAAAGAARARAPAQIRPGDAVPFLVPIGDAPPDLEGASLRIDVAPAGGTAP